MPYDGVSSSFDSFGGFAPSSYRSPSYVYVDNGYYDRGYGHHSYYNRGAHNPDDTFAALRLFAFIGVAFAFGKLFLDTNPDSKEQQMYFSPFERPADGTTQITIGPKGPVGMQRVAKKVCDTDIPHGSNKVGVFFKCSDLPMVNRLDPKGNTNTPRAIGAFGFACIASACIFDSQLGAKTNAAASIAGVVAIITAFCKIPYKNHGKPLTYDAYKNHSDRLSRHIDADRSGI